MSFAAQKFHTIVLAGSSPYMYGTAETPEDNKMGGERFFCVIPPPLKKKGEKMGKRRGKTCLRDAKVTRVACAQKRRGSGLRSGQREGGDEFWVETVKHLYSLHFFWAASWSPNLLAISLRVWPCHVINVFGAPI